MYAVSPSKFHNDQTSAPTTLNTQFFNHAATAAETRPTIQGKYTIILYIPYLERMKKIFQF